MKATLLLVWPSSSLLSGAQICVFMQQESFSGMHMEDMTTPDPRGVRKGKGVARAAGDTALSPIISPSILLTLYSSDLSLHTSQVQRRTCSVSAFCRKDNVNKGVPLLVLQELKVRDT